MKNIYTTLLLLLGLVGCSQREQRIIVENTSTIDRIGEVVELQIEEPDAYVVVGPDGKPIETQTTYDHKIIFQASVAALSTEVYTLRRGERPTIDTVVTGKVYPNRKNDFAWESDKIGYRVYSKTAGESGERLLGYDVFTKRGRRPVLEQLYTIENDPHDRALVLELKETNPIASKTLSDAISYHIDHGQGMDYYPVGPTLGCGTAALMSDEGEIIYPEYYDKVEVLDQGGLRITFRLTFDPVEIGGEQVTEIRTITLNAGSHFNLVEVEYQGLTQQRDVVAGIVIHDSGEAKAIGDGYMAYAEPTHLFGWQTYCAVVFDQERMTAAVEYFAQPKGTAQGHIIAKGHYEPNTQLSYFMGAGWNRWEFTSAEEWFEFVAQQERVLKQPLCVSYEL
ncbi:MAG: DUF4861 family protein [Rikenellaceae bacterium]